MDTFIRTLYSMIYLIRFDSKLNMYISLLYILFTIWFNTQGLVNCTKKPRQIVPWMKPLGYSHAIGLYKHPKYGLLLIYGANTIGSLAHIGTNRGDFKVDPCEIIY